MRKSPWWHTWGGFGAYLALIAVLGFATLAWTRSLSSDEAIYYAPAIEFAAEHFPALPLREYPFPAPPLALWLQGGIYAWSGSFVPVRIFSTCCSLLLGLYLFRREGTAGVVRSMALLTFPFLLWNSFTLKQHAFAMLCLVMGLDRWMKLESRSGCITASTLFASAVLTNQFCAPLCLACSAGAIWRRDNRRAVAALLPLVVLGGLVLFWNGPRPPGFVDPLAPAEIGRGWRTALAQGSLGFISLGVWLAPLVFRWRDHGKILIAVLLPCVGAIWASGVHAGGGEFWTTAQGPVSRALTAVAAGNAWLLVGGAAFLTSLGVAFVARPAATLEPRLVIRTWVFAYLAAAVVAVPYLFESYYLMLVVPLAFYLTETMPEHLSSLRHRAFFGLATLGGCGYAAIKLIEKS